ncbi:MAG: AI-2E family transporter [Myxococcales bacterium]|nr:AI-2E family transporter [Myxococcales bacterium]MDP3504858.1 AI-2E family transporter [Myxococcales bacterium]
MSTPRPLVAVAFFVALFLAALFGLLYVLSPFIADFVLAWMFASLFGPLYGALLRRWPKRRSVAAALVTGLVAVAILVPVGFIGGSLSAEATTFYENTLKGLTRDQLESVFFGGGWLPVRARAVAEALGTDWNPEKLSNWVVKLSGAVAGFVSAQVNLVVANVLAASLHFVLMLFIVFTMLVDGERLKRYIFATSPLPDDEEARLIDTFNGVARATLVGNGLGSLIQGVLGGVSMAVVGISSPVLWGAVMTVFAFLPLLGISVVTVPATLVLLFQGRYAAAIGFQAFNLAQGLIVENVVKTRLIGAQMKLPSLLIFLSIIGGLSFFGVLGIVYGPLIVALYLTLSELYHQRYKQLLLGELTEPPPSSSEPAPP